MNVFLDADGVLVDFEAGAARAGMEPSHFKLQPGAYLFLPLFIEAVAPLRVLQSLDADGSIKVWIATKPPLGNPYAAAEKILYFEHHLPWLKGRVIVTHDKSILGGEGDILVDDRPHKANASKFKGTFIPFNPLNPSGSWVQVLDTVRQTLQV